jgi:hypothetical protein
MVMTKHVLMERLCAGAATAAASGEVSWGVCAGGREQGR